MRWFHVKIGTRSGAVYDNVIEAHTLLAALQIVCMSEVHSIRPDPYRLDPAAVTSLEALEVAEPIRYPE